MPRRRGQWIKHALKPSHAARQERRENVSYVHYSTFIDLLSELNKITNSRIDLVSKLRRRLLDSVDARQFVQALVEQLSGRNLRRPLVGEREVSLRKRLIESFSEPNVFSAWLKKGFSEFLDTHLGTYKMQKKRFGGTTAQRVEARMSNERKEHKFWGRKSKRNYLNGEINEHKFDGEKLRNALILAQTIRLPPRTIKALEFLLHENEAETFFLQALLRKS